MSRQTAVKPRAKSRATSAASKFASPKTVAPKTAQPTTAKASTASANGRDPFARRAFDLVMKMMAIPGRSGEEGAIVEFIRAQLLKAGAPASAIKTDDAHKKSPLKGEIGNLSFTLPGTLRQPRRLLMAHVDTVPICVGSQPVCKGDVVRSAAPRTGLGGDDRAGSAVILNAALEILERKLPHPPLTFFWPVQEEVGLYGARLGRLSNLGKIGLAFNWDGGAAEKLTIGATGAYRLWIEITGLASHAGGAPEEGVSAIAVAGLAIADLVENGWHGLILKNNIRGTSNIGVIRGGEATNVVTDHLEVRAEARSHDPKFRLRIAEAIEQAFAKAAKQVRSASGQCAEVKIERRLEYESFKLAEETPAVVAAQAAVRAIGQEPLLAIANGGLDANWMTARGIPTVTLGCGQAKIHTVSEELHLPAFHRACRIALHLATAQ